MQVCTGEPHAARQEKHRVVVRTSATLLRATVLITDA